MAGTTIWGPVVSLVLIASPDGFPRNDTTQALHAFRANPAATANQPWFALYPKPSVRIEAEGFSQPTYNYSPFFGVTAPTVAQSTQWAAGASLTQVAEFEFETRRSKPDQLHLYRQAFQTVGQPWNVLFPRPSNRVEAEGFSHPKYDYSLFFGRTAQPQPPQPWSAYKWTSPVPDIREFRPQWTDHNLAYAPFQTRVGILANQPWSAYKWQIPTPDTAPYVEYRSRDFWSDYLPFTLTPTITPPPPSDDIGGDPPRRRKTRNVIKNGKFVQEKIPNWPFEQTAESRQTPLDKPPKMAVQNAEDEAIVRAVVKLMFDLM